jgi:orotidine-5'-phosphate decarboxylase
MTRNDRPTRLSPPEERLILALDVPSHDEALRVVEELEGLVSFFKVGLELLMAGGIETLLRRLAAEKRVFLDLKLPGDIPATVQAVVRSASSIGVRFLTLSHSAGETTIRAAVAGREQGHSGKAQTELLGVPFLSSEDATDFARQSGQSASDFQDVLLARASAAKSAGVDGFIVSGKEIELLRSSFPEATLVSPGVRPTWSPKDDHKRACTPAQAIEWGADYLVVGRPIRSAPGRDARRDAAKRVIDEIASATHARP